MKTKAIVLSAALLAGAVWAVSGADNLSEALQKGLLEEEANHNLDAAIQAYQSVVNQYDDQRKIAATAVFRLGECYRKQGKTNEAALQYQRVLGDFADQAGLIGPSEKRLAALGQASAHAEVAPGARLSPSTELVPAGDEEAKEIGRLRDIIKNSPDLINARDLNGSTPLHNAAIKGQLAVASFLLQAQADVSARDRSDSTPLHLASQRGHKAMVELLLAHGANVNARNNTSMTPLHFAAEQGYLSVAQVLVAKGAEVNARRMDGRTPLHGAAAAGSKAVVELLLANKAEVNVRDDSDSTPLARAVSGNHVPRSEERR